MEQSCAPTFSVFSRVVKRSKRVLNIFVLFRGIKGYYVKKGMLLSLFLSGKESKEAGIVRL